MPQFEFRVLCQNRGDACTHVKNIMREQFSNVKGVSSTKTYDHTGRIILLNSTEAIALKRHLKTNFGNNVRSIEIASV